MPVKINGATSGSVTLAAPDTGSDVTLTLPAAAGTAATTAYADAAGGLQLITSQTFSAVSAVNVNNCFTATYSNYLIRIASTISTTGTIQMRLRSSGTDNSSSNYYYHSHTSDTSSQTTYSYTRSVGLSTFFHIGNVNGVYDASVDMNSPNHSRATTVLYQSVGANATDMQEQAGGGLMSVTTSYDGFSIVPSAGTITGTIRVYGYKNS